ncbi:hypothetical protein C1645_817149 [Glomus cerebriforme]|uniref:Uncharacterized protein n=1 Tax=Glomus cerebriforme TaxID=658196 RepID=A0A397TJ56_9GLOM|nr:hypothetical protein C1645_817149 [Glomus cerebriforme]
MFQSELLEFLDVSIPYYCGVKVFDIGVCFYKIHDNNIKSRYFLDADNKDEIEVILLAYKDHFLYKFIDSDELLHPFIDFDLSVEILNAIISKLSNTQAKNLLLHF